MISIAIGKQPSFLVGDVVLATAFALRLGCRSGDPRRGGTSRRYPVWPWLGRNLHAGKTLDSSISIQFLLYACYISIFSRNPCLRFHQFRCYICFNFNIWCLFASIYLMLIDFFVTFASIWTFDGYLLPYMRRASISLLHLFQFEHLMVISFHTCYMHQFLC